MSNVVAAMHVDEQCGCSPHSLPRDVWIEVKSCIALHHLHLYFDVYLNFYEAIDVSIIMLFKFDA